MGGYFREGFFLFYFIFLVGGVRGGGGGLITGILRSHCSGFTIHLACFLFSGEGQY